MGISVFPGLGDFQDILRDHWQRRPHDAVREPVPLGVNLGPHQRRGRRGHLDGLRLGGGGGGGDRGRAGDGGGAVGVPGPVPAGLQVSPGGVNGGGRHGHGRGLPPTTQLRQTAISVTRLF